MKEMSRNVIRFVVLLLVLGLGAGIWLHTERDGAAMTAAELQPETGAEAKTGVEMGTVPVVTPVRESDEAPPAWHRVSVGEVLEQMAEADAEAVRIVGAALQEQLQHYGDLAGASTAAREAVLGDMVALAEARKAELLDLLPRHANFVRRQLFSPEEVAAFPPEVRAQLETYVRGRGNFYVFCASPLPDVAFQGHSTSYSVAFEGIHYRAHLNENWEGVVTGEDYLFAAATLEDEMLLMEAPEDEEVFASPTGTDGSPNPGGVNKMLYMIGRFSDETDFAQSESEAVSRFGVTNTFYLNNSGGAMYFVGPDGTTPGGELMDIVFVDLPETRSYYEGLNQNNRLSTLLNDARTAASAQGFDHSTYNTDAIITSGDSWGYAGVAWLGSKGTHMPRNWTQLRTFGHELGHNFNLAHAYYWRTDAPTPLGMDSRPGGYVTDNDMDEAIEYAHYFSIMSAQHSNEMSDATKPHFSPYEKYRLGLLEEGTELLLVNTSGQYRVYRHDIRDWQNAARAIRIETPATMYTGNQNFRYWLGMRFANWSTANSFQRRGLQVDVVEQASFRRYPIQLDMTPYTNNATNFYDKSSPPSNWWTIDNNDKRDGALMVGRTYSDTAAGIHITPIAFDHSQSGEEYVDVVINLGDFPDNTPPVIHALTVSSTSVNTGETVFFSVDASDLDGDELAYGWEFDPIGTFTNSGFNEPAASKSWGTAGQYKVKVTVSDMKGGIASETAVITVGEPTNQREIWGRVLQAGVPLANARIFIGNNYQAWTDSDGSYRLVGLPSGTHTVQAQFDGVDLSADFSNPVDVNAGNAYGKDFSAPGSGGSSGDEATGSISGTITSSIGSRAGVEVEAGGIVAVTDANGAFSIEGLTEGSYQVSAYKGSRYNGLGNQQGWAFASSPSVTVTAGGNVNAGNIARSTFSVSGRVQGMSDEDPAPTIFTADGRSVTASWASTGSQQNRRYEYTFTAGSQQVNLFASASGFVIEPAFTNPLSSTGGNLNNRDFDASAGNVAGSIRGQVLHEGQPLTGVSVTAGGRTTRTDSDGYYLIPNLASGSYEVTVSHPGASFSPVSQSGVSVPATGIDFSAGGLNLDAVTASSEFVVLGNSVELTAAVSGGTGDYTLEWRGWQVAGPVSFSQNDSASLTTHAGFVNTGTHVIRLAVEDANGMRVTETVTVTVVEDSGGGGALVVTPFKSELFSGETGAFSARAWDSTGVEVVPAVTWSSNGGVIDPETGEFFPTANGTFTVTATDPTYGTAEATVTVEGTFEAPVIALLPEGNIIYDQAELRADLSQGGSNVAVDVWWGSFDGGSDAAAWENIYVAGSFDEGEISVMLPGLEAETQYFYRLEARNGVGSDQTETGQFTTTRDLSGIHPQITLLRPTVENVRIPEGVGLVLKTEVTETGEGSGTLTQAWTVVSGPGAVTWDTTTEAETAAFFELQGSYLLRLTADNGVYTDELDIAVEVIDPALIQAAASPMYDSEVDDGETAMGSPTTNLAVHLPLDESSGTVAADVSGNNRDGAIQGNPEWRPTDGKFGGALRFTDDNQYAMLADSSGLDNSEQMSWAWWMRPSTTNNNVRGILSKRSGTSSGQAWSFFLHNSNELNVDMPSSGNRLQVGVIPADAWIHVAVVFDGTLEVASRVRVYLNGELSGSYSAGITSIPNQSNSVTLGILDTTDNRSFRGDLDEVMIYHGRALTAEDVSGIYEGIPDNIGPLVQAGLARTVDLNDTTLLSGTVVDDGMPEVPGMVVTQWQQVDGPEAVSFDNPESLETGVTFPVQGAYTLRLTAFDGEVETAHDKAVTVEASLDVPEVTAWPTASDLVYGQTLGESTLSGGEASVPGSFVFVEPGTLPAVGTENYDVVFLPEDDQTYASVLGSVSVTVEPVPPELTLLPPADVTATTALLQADLTAGDPTTEVTVWYGLSDGGTEALAWDHVLSLGVQEIGVVDAPLSGLQEEAVYFYRFMASNSQDTVQTSTASFTTPKDLSGIQPQITLQRPTVDSVRIPAGVGLVLQTDVIETGGESDQLTLLWEMVSGDGMVTWDNTDQENTAAWFSAPGMYTLRLTADNGVNNDVLDITVEVLDGAGAQAVGDPWTAQDIGSGISTAGQTTFADGVYTMGVDSGDIWTDADSFHFAWQPMTGDGEIVAQVNFVGSVDQWAKAGVMMRATLDADSQHAFALLSGANGNRFIRRTEAGAMSSSDGTGTRSWVRLVREGDNFSVFASDDGLDWVQVHTVVAITMPETIYVGLALSSHNDGGFAEAEFRNVHLSGEETNVGPWVDAGPGQTVSANTSVALSGTVDDDGLPELPGAVVTEWLQLSGPAVTLSDVGSLTPTFTPAEAGELVFRLTAFDGEVKTASDVTILVEAGEPDPYEQWLADNNVEDGEIFIDGQMFATVDLFIMGAYLENDQWQGILRTEPLVADGNGGMTLGFEAQPGRRYRLQTTLTMTTPTWGDIGEAVEESGPASFTFPMPESQSFYRIRVERVE